MSATRRNPRDRAQVRPRRTTFLPSTAQEVGRSPVVSGLPTHLVDAIFAELHRCGVPASHIGPSPVPWSWAGVRAPAPEQPITAWIRAGSDAVVVVIDRSMVKSLFGESGGRVSLWLLLRAAKARSCENQLCETTTAIATAMDARRLLIVCDAGRTSVAERTRVIRWVREVAHRIGYECSINGLHDLGTSYLIVVADTQAGNAARSVVDWCRSGEVR